VIGGAAQLEIGVGVEILREAGTKLDVGRGPNANVETHPTQHSGAGFTAGRRGGGRAQNRADIAVRVKRDPAYGDITGDQTPGFGALQCQVSVGFGGNRIRKAKRT